MSLLGGGGGVGANPMGLVGGGGAGGQMPDPIGLGKYADKGLDLLNEAKIDKYAGGIAGAAAATYFTGGLATQQGWEIGSQVGDQAGTQAAGLNLFSSGEDDVAA